MSSAALTTTLMIPRKYERDIDLLLAEEFLVSPPFAQWFLKQTAFAGEAAVVENTHVSPSDDTGESDLVVVYHHTETGARFAIHIEDKIDAPIQPDQATRYQQRGAQAVQRGDYEDFDVVLCAPQFYRDHQSTATTFGRFVAFEAMAAFIEGNDVSARSRYRATFLREATSKRINAYQRVDDPQTNALWSAIYQIASKEFAVLEMKEPCVTKGTTWITLRPHDLPTMPQMIYVSAKCAAGQIDLTFSNAIAHRFEAAVGPLLATDMTIHQTGKAAAIRVKATPFMVSDPTAEALAKARTALAACARLIEFFRHHRDALMEAAAQSRT